MSPLLGLFALTIDTVGLGNDCWEDDEADGFGVWVCVGWCVGERRGVRLGDALRLGVGFGVGVADVGGGGSAAGLVLDTTTAGDLLGSVPWPLAPVWAS